MLQKYYILSYSFKFLKNKFAQTSFILFFVLSYFDNNAIELLYSLRP